LATSSQYALIVTRGHAVSTGERVTRPVTNVYCFRRPSGLFAPNKANILTAFSAAISANLAIVLSVSYIHVFTDCRMLDDPADPFTTVAGADSGTVAGDSLPSVNSVSLQLKTGIRGRKYRGAKRYGPIAESQTVLDHLDVTPLADWTTYAGQLLAGFTDSLIPRYFSIARRNRYLFLFRSTMPRST